MRYVSVSSIYGIKLLLLNLFLTVSMDIFVGDGGGGGHDDGIQGVARDFISMRTVFRKVTGFALPCFVIGLNNSRQSVHSI